MGILEKMAENPKFTAWRNKPKPALSGTGEKIKPLMPIGDAVVVIVGNNIGASALPTVKKPAKVEKEHKIKRSDYYCLAEISMIVGFSVNQQGGTYDKLPPPESGVGFMQKGGRTAKYWKKDSKELLDAIELIKKCKRKKGY